MFEDGSGIYRKADQTGYTSAVFGQKLTSNDLSNSTAVDATYTGGINKPFNYTDAAGLQKAADNTVLGNMNDCGECHVGGGAMEYIPNYGAAKMLSGSANPNARIPLRTATAPGGVLDGVVTAFNYLIDIFGPKGDGVGATYLAKQVDFAQTGVLEMDCLVCHLKDYSWEERKHAVRTLNFDASRVTGAGLGHYSSATDGSVTTPTRNVTYDMTKFAFVNGTDATAGIKMAPVVAANILAKPDSGNCASCHAATDKEKYQVEWKKRGDFWGGSEVHTGIGCMGCHERNDLTTYGEIDTAKVGTSGIANSSNKKLGMCDPAKGGDCSYDAQWNAMDKVAQKSCAYCHSGPTTAEIASGNGNGLTYGAPNADVAHQAAGLLAKIVQKQYSSNGQLIAAKNGVANASHLDVIDCTVCHTLKKTMDGITVTGGAVVDGTGIDAEGRLVTHDTVKVERDMEGNLVPYWMNGKLFVGNLLSSFFWRDNTSTSPNYDANNDTRKGGLDPLLPTHVALMNKANGNKKAMLEDGVVTSAELQGMIDYYQAHLYEYTGNGAAGTYQVRLSALGVPFKSTHNVAPAVDALGKNCSDCHSATGELFGKTIALLPKSSFAYGANQIVTYTKVNGTADPTDIHPSVLSKAGTRSVAQTLFATGGGDLSAQPVTKANLIYESTFKNRDTSWKTTVTGTAVTAVPGSGSVLKIEVKGTPVLTYTYVVPTPAPASMAALITDMGKIADGSFGFDVIYSGDSKFTVSQKTGTSTEFRFNPQTDVGPFGLNADGVLWKAEPIKAVIGTTDTSSRATWLTYMKDSAVHTAANLGIGIDPVASLGAITDRDPVKMGTQVLANEAFTVTAGAAQTGGFVSYAWTAYGATITNGNTSEAGFTFTSAGSKTITLTVTDEEGKVRSSSATVDVIATLPMGISWFDNTGAGIKSGTLTASNLPAGTTKVTIYWGDGGITNKTTGIANDPADDPDKGIFTTATRNYATAGNKLVKVYAYNGTTLLSSTQATITVSSTN